MSAYETSETSALDRKLDAIAYEISTQDVRLAALKVIRAAQIRFQPTARSGRLPRRR